MIYLASDHAGLALKDQIKNWLEEREIATTDCGATQFEADDDFPDFISKAAEAVSRDPSARGIIFGGSGQGEAIVANKFAHVRAAVFYGEKAPLESPEIGGRESSDPLEIVRLSREHNDANILSIGARFVSSEEAKQAVKLWLATSFNNAERHVRRIQKISDIEKR
ncbi:hypothetical protein A2631_03915 [Candidatus Daviesbacteria bacterium RIFCSPHIGHO2_01_FULL_44_29]|uniref:Ribose-5-phosphate isomerase n=1 Tax=Candidatus Daviesbacteria bacterium RIFCSPHIGHO2_02_FULL_43_12 TaxID=1797776 RepID=A0A1F5KG77_9BACT|nr:MAG: hypothetical protein A2631_03915 [Candidatus Daviesbacteria bacterium RIFCSPHIGHO2_01_FULL_44_29]OGE39878.1 MAG: hypothetical protein A3D25_03645 [Candidatus Daviesbacteria bacterium RIFCSPHIGHO2_02_FULL_43_12]OGE40675.1 MAG: hypothetical protein A3E86_04195 [Candidatus Daviesbacteria bacterium RIFCSPHIGHO2_12_FULL_47_45]OGE70441.1 MAG: hypothetical protein A3B55_01925 [Candidatus Daviesbacteria bacterium RIFCSPLOWO2_01_FULL_43_15]